MKIEILFPEFCNLFGDMYNMKYLKMCIPNAEFIETALEEEPTFVKQNVNLIYFFMIFITLSMLYSQLWF